MIHAKSFHVGSVETDKVICKRLSIVCSCSAHSEITLFILKFILLEIA